MRNIVKADLDFYLYSYIPRSSTFTAFLNNLLKESSLSLNHMLLGKVDQMGPPELHQRHSLICFKIHLQGLLYKPKAVFNAFVTDGQTVHTFLKRKWMRKKPRCLQIQCVKKTQSSLDQEMDYQSKWIGKSLTAMYLMNTEGIMGIKGAEGQ